jgi:CHAT domain-containing protein
MSSQLAISQVRSCSLTWTKEGFQKNNRFLGFGNPALNKDTLENQIDKFFTERGDFSIDIISQLYELPDTESELRNISKFFRKSELLFQNDATEQNFLVKLDKLLIY